MRERPDKGIRGVETDSKLSAFRISIASSDRSSSKKQSSHSDCSGYAYNYSHICTGLCGRANELSMTASEFLSELTLLGEGVL